MCTGGEQDLTVSGRGVTRDECEPMNMEQCEGGKYGLDHGVPSVSDCRGNGGHQPSFVDDTSDLGPQVRLTGILFFFFKVFFVCCCGGFLFFQ